MLCNHVLCHINGDESYATSQLTIYDIIANKQSHGIMLNTL